MKDIGRGTKQTLRQGLGWQVLRLVRPRREHQIADVIFNSQLQAAWMNVGRQPRMRLETHGAGRPLITLCSSS